MGTIYMLPLKDLNGAFDGLYSPGDQWYWRGDFVNEIPDEAIRQNREWNDRMPGFKCGSSKSSCCPVCNSHRTHYQCEWQCLHQRVGKL